VISGGLPPGWSTLGVEALAPARPVTSTLNVRGDKCMVDLPSESSGIRSSPTVSTTPDLRVTGTWLSRYFLRTPRGRRGPLVTRMAPTQLGSDSSATSRRGGKRDTCAADARRSSA